VPDDAESRDGSLTHQHAVGICAECADALEYALAAPLRDGPVVLLDWMPKEEEK
jgi:hypothetical protein